MARSARSATATKGILERFRLAHPSSGGMVHLHRQSLLGKIGLGLLVLFALMALCSFIPPIIDPMYHPMTGVDPNISPSTGPSFRHWLGTDFMGRDILSQLLAGARVAFMVGVSAAFMSIFLGTAIGMIAGYSGKVRGYAPHATGRHGHGHAHPPGGD